MQKEPKINIDIIVIRDDKVLLGLLSDKWNTSGSPLYGIPGREIHFGEKIGETVKRNIHEEFNCEVAGYEVISVNANYEFGNHFIGIGVLATIDGDIEHVLVEDWDAWEWFDLDDIPENLFAPAKNAIDSYLKKQFCVSE